MRVLPHGWRDFVRQLGIWLGFAFGYEVARALAHPSAVAPLVSSPALRALVLLWPPWAWFCLLSSGNHFWLEIAAGVALAAIGIVVVLRPLRPGGRRALSVSLSAVAIVAVGALLAGCGGRGAAVCRSDERTLAGTAFVFVHAPRSGERVPSGFRVTGCSSTSEGSVVWSLRARDGRLLASGFTQGGSQQPGPFAFTVSFAVRAQQIGQFEVDQPRITGEGFPPVRNWVPLVLEPEK
jgi:hypothetical protein